MNYTTLKASIQNFLEDDSAELVALEPLLLLKHLVGAKADGTKALGATKRVHRMFLAQRVELAA